MLLSLALTACPGPVVDDDAGFTPRDSGTIDSGSPNDSGTDVDSGTQSDAGAPGDSGVTTDAGTSDSGVGPITRLASCDITPGGCDEVFTGDGQYIPILDRDAGGQIFCIPAGTYKGLHLERVRGAPGAPLLITNCGGKVVFNSSGYSNGIDGVEVQYVHLSGAGDVNTFYGIEQKNAVNMGVDFDIGITDMEVDHIETHDNGYMGIGVRSYPRCDGKYHRGNFTQRNTFIHDNHVYNARTGEGFYIGTSHYQLNTASGYIETGCRDAGYLEPPLVNVKVYNNLLEDIGRDGIQVGSAISGMEIHHNVIKRYARTQEYGQIGGIQINPGSVGEVHHNWVEAFIGDDAGTAIQYEGGGTEDTDIHDNVLIGSPTPLLTLGYLISSTNKTIFRDNTVVSWGGKPAYFFCNAALTTAMPHQMSVTGNIFVGYSDIGQFLFHDSQGDWFKIFDGNAPKCPIDGHVYDNALEAAQHIPGNYYSKSISAAQFVNPDAGDFHLQNGSPATGLGADLLIP